MHEVGLMQEALRIALANADRSGAKCIHAMTMRIGPLAGVETEALRMAFEVVTPNTPAHGAVLHLDETPVICWCIKCECLFQSDTSVCRCPNCLGLSDDIRQGRKNLTWLRWRFHEMSENLDLHSPSHRVLHLHERVLGRNQEQAMRNREQFLAAGIAVINILSAPGSGKTALLERTLADLKNELRAAVIVGDLATDNDARRLSRSGGPIVQITTGTLCHLEASMIARACNELDLAGLDLLFIENVGNLVCPASFDLGESMRVVLTAVTEGEDKPLKYPTLFKTANVAIVSKIELADACGFDRLALRSNIGEIAPQAEIIELSARTGHGLAPWYARIRGMIHAHA